jgi:hypothetical protein
VDDPFFGAPFIDEDVWEDDDVRHRYVHGGFEGTDTRFAFYFPEAEHYGGRFIQLFEGAQGGHEGRDAHPGDSLKIFLEMARRHRAYLVECNTGHVGIDHGPNDQTITGYRANAQSARYARVLAEEMYGSAPRYGYQFGGSSGGLRSIVAMEHVYDVWDGAVPFVPGPFISSLVGNSMPSLPRMHNAVAILALLNSSSKAAVLDALEPGGGDPSAGLGKIEREAVAALFESGFPRPALFQWARQTMMTGLAPQSLMVALDADPGYLEDFWAVPGYAGADGELAHRLIDATATVSEVRSVDELVAAGVTEHPFTSVSFLDADALGYLRMTGLVDMQTGRGFVSEGGWPADTLFDDLTVISGTAAGQRLTCFGTFGDVLIVAGGADVGPGDEVVINNRRFLAAALYPKYEDQRGVKLADGRSPSETKLGIGGQMMPGYIPTGMTARFHGKMIMFAGMLDVLAPPLGPVLYDEMVHQAYGEETDNKFRLWWVDNTCHTGMPMSAPIGQAPETRSVMYGGVLQEALRCVIDWVEDGIEPAPSTVYRVEDGQVVLAPSATERQGVQPVATATANGGSRADVKAREPVTFEVLVETPPQGGRIVDVSWDFDGSGQFAFVHDGVDGSSSSVKLSTTYSFERSGTYFPAVRVVSERDGRLDATLGRMENLARVRVVVA